MPRTSPTFIALAASLALATGCGADAKPTRQASATTAAKPGTASLYGTYERHVSKADIERTDKIRSDTGPGQEKPKPDDVVLTIAEGDPKGTVTATGSDGFAIAMDMEATSGGRLVLPTYVDPRKGAYCGPDIPVPATYSWKLNGHTLTLRAQGDPCADRDSTLSGTWTRR